MRVELTVNGETHVLDVEPLDLVFIAALGEADRHALGGADQRRDRSVADPRRGRFHPVARRVWIRTCPS
jgi:hypothetical protein